MGRGNTHFKVRIARTRPARNAGRVVPTERSTVDLARELSALIDVVTPLAVQAAGELGVPDALAGGPLPVEELAARLGCYAPSLARLLNTLCQKDVFAQPAPGVYALAPLGELLRSDHPLSLREANLPWLPNMASLTNLAHSVRTGRAAFEHVHGTDLWHYLAAHPDDAAHFDRQMRSISRFEAESLLDAYDWARFASITDVGGGDGALLNLLLAAHPGLRGTLFDQPQVAAKSTVDAVGGDFFTDDIPSAELYVLKRIVYGFDDEQAARILANVRRAATPGATLLLVEPFLLDGAEDADYFTHRVDLLMMAVPGGRVRHEKEQRAMLDIAGFDVTRIIGSATPAIEAVAR